MVAGPKVGRAGRLVVLVAYAAVFFLLPLAASASTTWSLQTSGSTNTIDAVSCPSASTCFAIDAGGYAEATTSAGTIWSSQAALSGTALYAVSCPSTTSCIAVGATGSAARTTNGTSWTAIYNNINTNNDLRSIACLDTSTCYMVGAGGVILVTTDFGNSTTAMSSGTTNNLWGVDCTDSSHCWAVGDSGTIRFYNGSFWSSQSSGTSQSLRGVSCVDASHCWAVGASGTILDWNGSSWASQTSGTTATLAGIACPTTGTCWAVGTGGTILATSDGSTWSSQSSGTNSDLNGVWFADASDGWAVGASGTIDSTVSNAGGTPPSVDTGSYTTSTASSSNILSWSQTVGTQSNRILLASVSAEYGSGGCSTNSVTYNGSAMTKIADVTSSNDCVSLWYMLNPASGTHTVSATLSVSAQSLSGGGAVIYNATQAPPEASNSSYNNSGVTSTSVTTTDSNSIVVGSYVSGNALTDLAPASGQTLMWSVESNATEANAMSYKTVASPSSTTMSWTHTSENRSAQVVAAFAPVDTSPPGAFSISSPSAGVTVSNGQTISSSPTDNVGVASVDYRYCAGSSCTYASGTEIASTTSGPPFSVTWSSQPVNGTYTLIAHACDAAGNCTDSSTTTVTVNNGSASWYSPSWGWRKLITIDHTKVAASQTSFPVLINLSSDADLAAHAQSSGNDILFTASDGTTKLNHEIESYTSSTGALVAWVLVPNLSSTTDTKIYMYFGNPSASNQQNVSGTWGSSNFNAVWHLPNGSSLSLADSTSNSNNGTNHGATATSGQIDGAASFSSSNSQYVSVPSGALPSNDNFTVSLWFKTSSRPGVLFSEQNAAVGSTPSSWDPMLYVDSNGKLEGGIYTGSTPGITSSSRVDNGSWHYAVLSVNKTGTAQTLYLDGSQVGTWNGTPEGPFSYVSIGAGYTNGWPNLSSATTYFSGQIDEVRVSNSATAHSSTWIATEWANQSSPSTFYSVGSVESADTSPPSAFSISSPSAGVTVSNGQTISSSPADNVGVASVDYRYCPGSSCTYASGTEIASTTSGPPFSVTWSSQPANGTYTLIAHACDAAGNCTDSSTTTVIVHNQTSTGYVQSGTAVFSSGNSITPTLGTASTAGTLLVAYVQLYSTTTVSAPSGWLQATSAYQSGAGAVAIWYYPNNPGGITSVTFTTSSSGGYFVGQLSEWSGVAATSPLDQTGSATGSSRTSLTVSTSSSTTTGNELAITGFVVSNAPSAFNPGSGWSNVFSAPSDWATSDYKLGIASGSTVSETETDGGTSNSWAGVIATFKPASSCSGGALELNAPSLLSFPAVTLNGSDQATTATLSLTPDDETASGAGWNITGTSTTLTGSSNTLSTNATKLTAAAATAATGNCSLPTNSIGYPITLPAGVTPPTAVKLYNAAASTGTGPTTLTLTFQIAVPANANPASYSSTWTIAIVSGP